MIDKREAVCVTGGSGGIGQALLEQLIGAYHIKALFRGESGVSARLAALECTPVWGDLDDHKALAELVKGTKFVFHCAALVTQASYRQSYQVNVEGTRNLVRAAAAAGCRRFIHVSSVAVYSGTPFTSDYIEDTELSLSDEMAVYSSTKLQSEHAVRDIARQHNLEYTIVRPTFVYGPNTKSYTVVPLGVIGKGLPIILGEGKGILDAVYVDDVARALILAAHSPQANGEIFNIGNEAVDLNKFYSYYGRMLNRPVRRMPIERVSSLVKGLASIAGSFRPRLVEIRKGVQFLVDVSQNTKRFPSMKARRLLGYAPEVNLTLGMLKTEIWARKERIVPSNPYFLDFYGTLAFRPLALVHPSSEEEIVRIVRTAIAGNLQVKAIGSLHSFSPIPETEGICLVLDRYNKLLRIDTSSVTVQAGMKVKDLNRELAEQNLALPITGAITAQTVSGAISTATHGGSLHFGSLSDYVESVRMIRADGSIVEFDRSHAMFSAVIVSMGLLGILSTVTFRCVPLFFLQSRSSVRTVEDVLANFDELNRSALYMDMLYHAVTDQIEILTIDRLDQKPIEPQKNAKQAPAKPSRPSAKPRAKRRLTISLLKTAAWLFRKRTSVHRYFTRFSVGSSYRPRTGRSDLVLGFSDSDSGERSPGILQDMEAAVPYKHACAVIRLLRNHFEKTGKYPLLPVHIRCSGPSEMWLSPAYRREVCWLEFWQYPRTDTLLQQIHELLKPYGYRFHWGKDTVADGEYIRKQYENWDAFVALRSEFDPNGMFLNSYLESFFIDRTGKSASASAEETSGAEIHSVPDIS